MVQSGLREVTDDGESMQGELKVDILDILGVKYVAVDVVGLNSQHNPSKKRTFYVKPFSDKARTPENVIEDMRNYARKYKKIEIETHGGRRNLGDLLERPDNVDSNEILRRFTENSAKNFLPCELNIVRTCRLKDDRMWLSNYRTGVDIPNPRVFVYKLEGMQVEKDGDVLRMTRTASLEGAAYYSREIERILYPRAEVITLPFDRKK